MAARRLPGILYSFFNIIKRIFSLANPLMNFTLRLPLPVLTLAALHSLSSPASGQTDPRSPEPGFEAEASRLSEEEVVDLESYVVKGSSLESSALPTDRLADSLFGPHRSALETPRSFSVLPKEILEAAVIRGLGDLSRVSTSADTPNTFGLPSLPRIRGQEGEIFQNGLRRIGGNNGFGLPISFNSVERIDVVKGPATPVLGPTRRVGGYVDLHTKRPNLLRTEGSVAVEYGSYESFRSVIDASVVLDEGRSALRVSWERLDADSFYDFVETDSDSLYLAYTFRPSEDLRLALNAEYYEADYSDNAGWNRVTQDLIDNGVYITGTGVSPVTGAVPGPNAVISPGKRVNRDGSVETIPATVKLERDRVLTDPLDFSEAKTFLLQAEIEATLFPGLTLTNRSHFQTLEKDQVNQNSFVEIIDDLHVVENRSEVASNFDFALGGLAASSQSVSGIDLRYQEVKAFSQFLTEADNPIDLTAPVETRRIGPEAIARRFGIAEEELGARGLVELRPNVFVSPAVNHDIDGDGSGDFGISDTNETELYQLGLFHQHDIQFADKWSLLAGSRFDLHHAQGEDPAAPDGFSVSDKITEEQGAFNASLNFAPSYRSNYYLTYNYSQSFNSALGGGLTLDPDSGELKSEDFAIDSELVEVGAKRALLDDRLFLSLAGYYQTRSERNRDGTVSDLKVTGAELEAIYQPSESLYALFGASWMDARFDDEPVFQGTRRIEDAFDDSRPDIIEGAGIGSPNFTVFPPADHEFPGLPDVTLNGLFSYTHKSGFGVVANAQWESEQNLDVLGRVVIPDQFSANGTLFYRAKRFEVRLDVLNLTDEENFSPVFNGFFGADLVFPEEPRRFQASATYKF